MAELNSTPATSYARAAREWAPLDWWKLEARALHHLPRLRRALAFFAPSAAWRDLGASVAPAWGCLVTLSHIASFVLPIIAFLLIVPWVFDRDDIAQVGVAGILAGIAAVLGGNGLITEVRESLGTDPGIHRLLGALHLIPSVLAAGVAVLAISEEAAAGAFGVLGLVADVVVGLLHFLLFRGPAHRGSDRWRRNLKRLEEAVESMPPAERARVSADLQGALEVLAERGLIDGAEWDRARGVRIGLLGISMAPREDMTPR
ncbi:hypothetical protein CLV49_1260 [Labedella gwakjiensis]|uniref:Uncharacterized protein n=1 Tax=Labedella gwakjiensis TaxID=390269 RepID=A0A2P8GUM1_9MICO|nr:hypothetical protein [Labedella gwakjiensis]PSL37653.1 hypothetical protein CLV49_1260 [Labedella gwakjiensis]RUQ87751.1 hypothetical protein ELQ93_12900 [Labedella gwakjiensis]